MKLPLPVSDLHWEMARGGEAFWHLSGCCLALSVYLVNSAASCSKPFIFEQEITEAERANREGAFRARVSHVSIRCGSAVHTS